MNLPRIKTFLFDLGNVIMAFSHDRMFRQIADLCELDHEKVRKLFIEGGIGHECERGNMSLEEVHALVCKEAGKPIDLEAFKDAGSNIFFLREEMSELLHQLKTKGYRLILLSNTNDAHFEFISKRYRFLDLFDGFTLSFQVGAMKPDTAIYHHAVNLAACAPEECFYIDDIPEYVAAAEQLGIPGHVFQSPEHLISELKEKNIVS